MLTIKRTCSNKIITRALQSENKPLIALLALNAEDCEPCSDATQLTQGLKQRPQSAIVYNQHPDALNLVANLDLPAQQLFIEITQDTKGVLGLQALRRNKNQRETLELVYA